MDSQPGRRWLRSVRQFWRARRRLSEKAFGRRRGLRIHLLQTFEGPARQIRIATNHADKLDPAAMRRFVFKIHLKPLASRQAARAFRTFFGLEAPAGLGRVEGLTPGDFAVVARQQRFHSVPPKAEQIVDLLSAEVGARAPQRRPIGFRQAKHPQALPLTKPDRIGRPGPTN